MTRQVSDEELAEFVHGAWPGLYRTAYLLLGDAALAENLGLHPLPRAALQLKVSRSTLSISSRHRRRTW